MMDLIGTEERGGQPTYHRYRYRSAGAADVGTSSRGHADGADAAHVADRGWLGIVLCATSAVVMILAVLLLASLALPV